MDTTDEQGSPQPQQRHIPGSAEEIALIDSALARTKGNRREAAIMLGMDQQRLEDLVRNRQELRARWCTTGKEPVRPQTADEIDRGAMPSPLSPEQVKMVDAVLRQDALLQRGWKRMGVSEKDREFLQAMQLQYATNLRGTMDLAYGSSAHATAALVLMLEGVRNKIADIEANPGKYVRIMDTQFGSNVTKGPEEYRKEYSELAVRIAGELRKMAKDLAEVNKLRLVMAKMALENEQAEKKKVAGWTPGQRPEPKPSSVEVVDGDQP